jgi:hypothetical protein
MLGSGLVATLRPSLRTPSTSKRPVSAPPRSEVESILRTRPSALVYVFCTHLLSVVPKCLLPTLIGGAQGLRRAGLLVLLRGGESAVLFLLLSLLDVVRSKQLLKIHEVP